MPRSLAALALALTVVATDVEAQSDRAGGTRAVMFDTVIGVQDFFGGDPWETQVIVDSFTSVEVAPGLQASFRPLVWRKPNGEWDVFIDHASIRYEFRRGANWRIEAGRFPSPVGLGMMENRASVNDGLIWCHRPYYGMLPPFGADTPRHALVSAVYPLGATVHASGDHWDARAGLMDRAPVDVWMTAGATPRPNAIVGGGLSPRQGLRVGVSGAWGESGDQVTGVPYTLVNVEGEYAFGYTRVSGEWTRDVFEVAGGDRVATGWTLQAKQALTPRIFAHARFTTVESQAALIGAAPDERLYWSLDSTLGYLVSPEATVRVGHAAVRGWGGAVDHQIGVSLIWAKRWW